MGSVWAVESALGVVAYTLGACVVLLAGINLIKGIRS